ncbi:hypothetical protein COO60DRAFT_1459402 [Scenedesmus sp. NREL 46B-D3]|nr:hypothetical protein COO60DRAFT_1459402 [Scenedesmus sp. NREL 46B-D3]
MIGLAPQQAYWGMVYRSNQSFCTTDGIPTTVCFGFLRSLAALLEQEQPHSLVVAFDAPAKSFRHEALRSYKAQRGPAPPGFTPDLRNLQLLLSFMRVHTLSVPGYEADDVLAGAAQQAAAAGYVVRIYSSDQDLWQSAGCGCAAADGQVVDDAAQVAVLAPLTPAKGAPRPRRGQGQPLTAMIDEAAVANRLGITPAQVPDFKALVGDSSDNLPGIPGIGPKTAAGLLQVWGSAEAVFAQQAMGAHSAGVRNKLQGQEEAAAMREAAPELDFGAAALTGFCTDEVRPLLERLELMSLAKPDALCSLQLLFGGQAAPDAALAARVSGAEEALELARPAPELAAQGEAAAAALHGALANSSSSSADSDMMQLQSPLQAAAADKAAGVKVLQPRLVLICTDEQLSGSQVLDGLQLLLQDAGRSNVFFESKRCFTELKHWGLQLAGVEFDVLLAACLLDPEKWTEGRAGKQRVLDPQRQQHQALPAMAVLSSMEVAGIGADRLALEEQQAELQGELAVLESRLFELAGRRFNLSSRQQLSQVIFQELGVQARGQQYSVPRTKATGMESTKEEVLRQLEPHPFVTTYLEWAGLNTMLTKYYNDAYIGAVQGPNPHTGRVHTTLVQVGGATGRINSVNPNLQTIPVHIHGRHAAAFRSAFNRPAPGYVLVSADYSQAELRVVAALAQEQALQEAFAAGRDVHEATARVLLDRQPGEPVDKEERQMGKRVNFSIVYGAGSSKIGKDAGVTSKEAQDFLKRFYRAYPSLFEYMTKCQRSAVASGYTSSVLGRRRLFAFSSPALQALRGSRDPAALPDMRGLARMASREDAEALRQAGNAPIQGTSADILKIALLQLHSVLTAPPWSCRILLTVHDSVVLEVPQAQWPAAGAEITRIMEGVLQQHKLNLTVDMKEGCPTRSQLARHNKVALAYLVFRQHHKPTTSMLQRLRQTMPPLLMHQILGGRWRQSRLLDSGRQQAAGGLEVMAPVGQQQQERDKLGLLSPFSPVFDLELEKRANSGTLERCCSEHALAAGEAAVKPTLFQQILQLCRCTTPVAAQLLQQVQRLRIAFTSAPNNNRATGSPPAAINAASATAAAAGGGCAVGAQGGFLAPESSMDIEAMACELLASGYLVQVRDGAQQQERTKTMRSCLQNLRHRFVVCLGWRGSAEAEAEYLAEPLVVEPRFREQFAIAHPTAEYEALLQAVPSCFVGSVASLESIVKLLCEQMVAAFKVQGLPVPPWRTCQALLSKWSPTQLTELAAKIANVRRLSIDMAAYSVAAVGAAPQAHDRLRNGDRPAAAHAPHAAVGSAPPVSGDAEAGQQQCPRGVSPAAADVMALLEAAEGFNNGVGGSSTLKFTRKASAEWKNQRSNGRKMKGLLAAALKKPTGGSSRSNLGMALPPAASPVAAADALGQPLAALPGRGGSHQQQQQVAAQRDGGTGPDALIRRTHYRASGDEPWRRITTDHVMARIWL